MRSLELIDYINKKIAPGSFPSFTPVHVFTTIKEIGAKGPIGRVRLSIILQLGEGSTRTLIKRLQKEGVIQTTKFGCSLTDIGKKIYEDLSSKISDELELPPASYSVNRFNVAILIREGSKAVDYGVEQRDAALRMGASGATTLIFRKGKLVMPGMKKNFFENSPEIYERLILNLEPKDGDSIVIGSADEKKIAEFGAKAAALEMVKKL